jgi:hypothetical protein
VKAEGWGISHEGQTLPLTAVEGTGLVSLQDILFEVWEVLLSRITWQGGWCGRWEGSARAAAGRFSFSHNSRVGALGEAVSCAVSSTVRVLLSC